MRRIPRLAALAVLVPALLAACGDLAARTARDEYVAKVDPLLERDVRITQTIFELFDELSSDPTGRRYFPYLDSAARPFHEEMRTALAAIVPGDPAVAAAHEDLVRYADLMREFLREEKERSRLVGGMEVVASEEARVRAGAAETEYVALLEGDLPDARFQQLAALRDEVLRGIVPELRDGRRDLADAQDRIRRHVLPKVQELREGRFEDDERSKALRRVVVLSEEALRKLADVLPATVSTAKASEHLKKAHEARRRAVEALSAPRRKE